MLTPCFDVAQDDAFIIITMRVPYAKVSEKLHSAMLYVKLMVLRSHRVQRRSFVSRAPSSSSTASHIF